MSDVELIDPIQATKGFDQYQIETNKTAQATTCMGHPVIYPAFGLANEAGEVAGKIKKIFRDKNAVFSEDDVKAIEKELGDCLWYLAQTAEALNIRLEDVAYQNLVKLLARQVKGTIQGSGDDR